MNTDYKPVFYNPRKSTDLAIIEQKIKDSNVNTLDQIESQIGELVLCRNPKLAKNELHSNEEFNSLIKLKAELGNWVYYSWNNSMVHLLEEKEFIEVRTNRNRNKITREEQAILSRKTVAIAGLSVGRSAALTLASERSVGRLILADFDKLELSNLNRIKASVMDLGLHKTTSTAREIAAIDPYLSIKCVHEGLNKENLNEILKKGTVDLFLEECDDLEMKIEARLVARSEQIPVVMEASDRCLVDIERFDLEPERPILHGIIDEDDIKTVGSLKTFDEKLNLMAKIVDVNKISERMKLSLPEIGNTLRTWPQLSSDVTYGAGITATIIRKILLGESVASARHYFDIDLD